MNPHAQLATLSEPELTESAPEPATWRQQSYLIRTSTLGSGQAEPSSEEFLGSPAAEDVAGAWVAPQPIVVPLIADVTGPRRFQLLQQWEGTVTGVTVDSFDAELRDLTDPSKPKEAATFSLDEITDDERGLVKIGAVFYWSIGHERLRLGGQKRTVSLIRLRRLPAWSRSDIKAIREEADALASFFDSIADPDAGRR